MQTHIFFKEIKTPSELFQFDENTLELQEKIHSCDSQNLEKILALITTYPKIDQIILLAQKDFLLYEYCQHEQLTDFWLQRGFLSLFPNIDFNFQIQESLPSFDLVSGYFFYQEAMKVRNTEKKPFTGLELEFLKLAVANHSIHAAYQLNQYDYQKIKENHSEMRALGVIQRCKLLIQYHKIAAAILLIEAYIRFSSLDVPEQEKQTALILAGKICKWAIANFNKDQMASEIRNGGGIKMLNSWELDSLVEINEQISTLLAQSRQNEQISTLLTQSRQIVNWI